jgi:hypothetical protein
VTDCDISAIDGLIPASKRISLAKPVPLGLITYQRWVKFSGVLPFDFQVGLVHS